ncbi:MAG: 2-C-methyl-D-erythritol 4-phosphate cytidylyltransferase [Chthoniobacterales bacterium]|nr:MAG: 2-C-methyl-D-erythritol 4-phosphate cytidylyltransferase [Chthoniobacterales bacterium]
MVDRLRLSAITVAAGSSTRTGFDKVLAQLAGEAVIKHSLCAFDRAASVDSIVVVVQPAKLDEVRALTKVITKVSAVVAGGERRQDSVEAGLSAVAGEFVAVHDAARPLITPGEIERIFSAAQKHGAAVLAAPVTDTLKTCDSQQFVSGSIDRANVFAMQTPQIFRRSLLLEAFGHVADRSLHITDEVSAVQLLGAKVAIVPAREHNMKITFAGDLALAEFILQSRHSERSLG